MQDCRDTTICALATATGGAIGVIRVSGPEAFPIVGSLCAVDCAAAASHSVHLTRICSPQGEVVDEVLVSIFRAPHSYTGEDSVEISCHGSRYVLNKVLELLLHGGCRMAQPGEFTMRAYLNGKMDLSQAEAVADLIASTNKATHRLAMAQLRGGISSELSVLRDKLLRLTSLLELELDFSDHEDLEFADRTELVALAGQIHEKTTRLAQSFALGQAVKQGIPVAIVGKPNVGKSTLLNALLRDDRAIVSNIPGTTRDAIEGSIDIRGVAFRLVDTAGLRDATDKVERIGIARSYAAIAKARIVLWVVDRQPTAAEVADMQRQASGKEVVVVGSKIDLNPFSPVSHLPATWASVGISAKTGEGMEELEKAIWRMARLEPLAETDTIVTSARHYEALVRATDGLERVLAGLREGTASDLVAEDLRIVIDDLAEITGGEITPQETLNNIFAHFCVGK